MHTIEHLDSADIEYRMDDRQVPRDEVMPAIGVEDRVGVVMGEGTEGLGAGNFLLSCIRTFYDRLEAGNEEFFEYPDYYTFQMTNAPADYMMLDIYPDHKNVAITPDAGDEELLQAVNDRAIDVLLVPDGPTGTPAVEDITRRSAERGIDHCFVYAADGHPDDSEFSIRLPRSLAVDWFEDTVDSIERPPEAHSWASLGDDDGVLTQAYRRSSIEGALSRLPTGKRR